MKYKPESSCKRHQKYFGAFSCHNITRYLSTVSRYIKDKNISHTNADDVDFLMHLLFDGPFGRVHISYYSQIHNRKRTRTHFVPSTKSLARYCDFLKLISSLFLTDFFNTLFTQPNKSLAGGVFKHLSFDNKLLFLHNANRYPNVLKQLPKIKLYSTFS